MSKNLDLKQKFDIIAAALLGLLGAKMQKQAFDRLGKNSKKAFNDPNPLFTALKKRK